MAPLKFEDHVREKLEERVIKPSANAWDELEKQLNTHSNNKKKEHNWVIGIAAASIVLLLMGVSFIQFSNSVTKKTTETVEVVVSKNDFVPAAINESLVVENSDPIQSEVDVTKENSSSLKSQNKKEINSSKINNKQAYVSLEVSKVEKQEDLVTTNEALSYQDKAEVFIKDSLVNSKINGKASEVLARVEELERANGQVTSEEIDNLLRNAQLEITREKLLKEGKTNALSLLEDVEEELDETFKQRVFETLKTSYSKLKTAVAERDN